MILMDFNMGFPMKTRYHDLMMVIVDNFYKEYHFILVKSMHKDSDIEIFS